MVKTAKARPAKQPARAAALCDDDNAEARRLAGVDQRKKTIASTMVYAGIGLRASERVKTAGPRRSTAKTSAAKKPATKRPAATSKPKARDPDQSELPTVPVDPSETAVKRKRTRTQSQLIARFVDTIDGQLDQIDAIMRDPNRGESGPTEAERHARTVAALARVTVELRKELEAGRRRRADDDSSAGRDQSGDPGRSGDPDRPRDLDELRERLSRRLDIRLAGGPAVPVAEDRKSVV